MESRERVIRAIERENPDRVPLEGVSWGEWSYPFLQRLLGHFGFRDTDALAERFSTFASDF